MDDKQIYQFLQELNVYKDRAYTPYSGFSVCALIIDQIGNKHFGVNVENASYGLTLCAERNALTSGITQGLEHITFILVVASTEMPVMPCGACRQVLAEFSKADTPIVCANFDGVFKEFTMNDLLPHSFNKTDLGK